MGISRCSSFPDWGMPAPVRQRAERDGIGEFVREGLQAGRVGRKGELAVADGQGILDVELAEDDLVARDEGAAVDGLGVRLGGEDDTTGAENSREPLTPQNKKMDVVSLDHRSTTDATKRVPPNGPLNHS
jgi:hypothetical protein